MSKIITRHPTLGSPVEDVWHTHTTFADYPMWNPFITSAIGVLAAGERLRLTVHPPGGRAMAFRPG